MKRNFSNTDLISLAVFLPTITVVLITISSIIFPSLIMGSVDEFKYPVDIDRFELGIWAFPLLITSFIVFAIHILYFKNKLPNQVANSLRFIFNFEVPTQVAFLAVLILLGIYIVFNVEELYEKERWEDFNRKQEPRLENWNFQKIIKKPKMPHLDLFLGNVSMTIFDSYRVIPFLGSIALLVLTFLLSMELSKKRFAGLVSLVVVMQSGNFLTYDTLITYPNFWIVFYILSLYLIYKKWPLSPFSYFLSIPSKALTLAFFPMTIFFIFRANVAKNTKIRLLLFYGILVLIGVSILLIADINLIKITTFDAHSFWSGFTAFSSQFRFDGLIVIFLLPLVVGLFQISRNGIKQADLVLVLILGMLLISAIMPSITGLTNNPYRFIPLVVFFALGVGVLLSKKSAGRSDNGPIN